ncbi:MAG: STAS domain-containing protein [Bacteroidetes bacterium]|nr:STAS domain-containing protein [Bacteroidota bacterium]
MNFELQHNENIVTVISRVEKLDANTAPELKGHFLYVSKNNRNRIIFDMALTKYCDSSGLSAILMANRLCRDTNGKFILCNVQPNVLKLISIAQLDKVIDIEENHQDSLSRFHS